MDSSGDKHKIQGNKMSEAAESLIGTVVEDDDDDDEYYLDESNDNIELNTGSQCDVVEGSNDVQYVEVDKSCEFVTGLTPSVASISELQTNNSSDVIILEDEVSEDGPSFRWGLPAGQHGAGVILDCSQSSIAASDEGEQLGASSRRTWPAFAPQSKPHSVITDNPDMTRDEESVNAESIEGCTKPFEGSSWPCSEPCSSSQSPLSYVVQLNEDSECSLQSLPPGETRHTGFNLALRGGRNGLHPPLRHAETLASDVIEDDSQGGNYSDRGDDMELMLEVETGSNQSEASVSVVDGGTLTAASASTAAVAPPSVDKPRGTSQSLRKKAMSSAAKSRIRKRLSAVVATDTDAASGQVTPSVFEYQWPLYDRTADWYLLQEHISEFLGILSFKRKYPDIYRRTVDIQERQFLQDSGAVTEMQCDLGLTALLADEVYDIMEKDYPDKFQEYTKVIHKKEKQRVAEQLRATEIPTEKSKFEIMLKKSIKSAADFNSSLMRELRQERRAYFDLQTNEVHFPRNKVRVLPADLTRISSYPVALIPGQFQDYYKRYTSAELNYFPVNTALYSPHRTLPSIYVDPQTVDSVPADDIDDDKPTTTGTMKAASVQPASDNTVVVVKRSLESSTEAAAVDDKSQDSVACVTGVIGVTGVAGVTGVTDTTQPAAKVRCVAGRKKIQIRMQLSSVSDCDSCSIERFDADVPSESANAAKCTSCGQTELNKSGEEEDLVCCAVCSRSAHPTCLDLTKEMIPIIKTYSWQCMECKTCVKCMKAHKEEKMMFCDHCDRGYHTFCVGLKVIPAGRWECASCTVASGVVSPSPPKPKRGRPFKYPRPQVGPQQVVTTTTIVAPTTDSQMTTTTTSSTTTTTTTTTGPPPDTDTTDTATVDTATVVAAAAATATETVAIEPSSCS